jgi:mRNA interferase RelE/StbE
VSRYRVDFTVAAARQLRKLEPVVRRRLFAAIVQLEENPRPAGAKKLAGAQFAWRLRVGDYRVIYEIEDDRLVVTVVRAAHRREVYE